ncbi:sodium hydrogen exchanger [Companilactobacillus tucceti DSM 20183]|uniref:Sodium hydrogen exchanger n=1 Tax=Companilactobacillus tucceti DSM 20183 TaxID=1423811 RepID=A0A0R1J3Q7_9LACO|nr:cation:proton antiporter [Companilactobacillus tucceti]KRK65775.1 sodium hydrogen exchanger [Companilactobacillus tucceti DSM 20183]
MSKFSVLITLFAALATPLIMARFRITRIPGTVAEIIMGIIIGKTGFDIIQPSDTLTYLANLGVIMLIFLGGMEIDFSLFEKKGDSDGKKSPLGLAFGSFMSVLAMSIVLSLILYYTGLFNNIILSTILVSTIALGVIISLLTEVGLLKIEYGQTLLLISAMGEFIPLVALTIYSAIQQKNYFSALLLPTIFIVAIILLSRFKKVYSFFDKVDKSTTQLDIRLAFFLIFTLVTVAEQIGAESILGAFLAGAVMKLLNPKPDTQEKLSSMAYGFFVPIFFIVTGVNLNLRTMLQDKQAIILIPIFFIAFILAKSIIFLILRHRFGSKFSFAAAILMSTTITLVLPILQVGQNLKIITEAQNGAITLAAIITCIVCPMIFNKILASAKSEKSNAE